MCIGVFSHIEPILPTIYANSCIQVSTFELTVEYNILASKISILPATLNVVAHI
jgi:hypothetical protein